MRAYIHAFQGFPWNEECEIAYRGFKNLGVECNLFTSNEELDTRTRDDIVVGGMLIMEHSLRQMGIDLPNYNYPEELEGFLGRRIWKTSISDLKFEVLPIFIKPLKEKAAKGLVVNSWDDITEYSEMDSEDVILCSEVVRFISEWRCFVRYGEILGIQFYYGDQNIRPDQAVVEKAVLTYKNSPAAFSLDFGVSTDGRTLLIEMNDGLAIGCYGLQEDLYAKFLTSRWTELTGILDPWR